MEPRPEVREEMERGRRRGEEGEAEEMGEDLPCVRREGGREGGRVGGREGGREGGCVYLVWTQCKETETFTLMPNGHRVYLDSRIEIKSMPT